MSLYEFLVDFFLSLYNWKEFLKQRLKGSLKCSRVGHYLFKASFHFRVCDSPNDFTRSIEIVENFFSVTINGILLPKLFWPTVRKNCSSDWEKKIRGWRSRICKFLEIAWTIYSNSERSEQFLVTEWFFNLFLEVFHNW